MEKILLVILIVLLALTVLGVFLFRHFVTNQIKDWGGMENPNVELENEQILDGNYTYVANDVLLYCIVGTWESTDNHWKMTLCEDYSIVVTLNGDTVLEDILEFTYLQPGKVLDTEFRLQSGNYTLRHMDNSTVGKIFSIYHKTVEGDKYGKICIELTNEKAHREIIEFRQYSTE